MFFLTNPMAYTMGRFLPERYKPAFYDSAVSFVHPITGIFPHANAGELFVYLGIAAGITTLGLNTSDLAVRYLLVGLVVILIRGIVTELITARMMSKKVQAERGGGGMSTTQANEEVQQRHGQVQQRPGHHRQGRRRRRRHALPGRPRLDRHGHPQHPAVHGLHRGPDRHHQRDRASAMRWPT